MNESDSCVRRYPDQPIVSVGAVVIDGDRVVLIKRGQEPLKGRWSLPGGVVETGEGLHAALVREVREETGLDVRVGPVVDVLDRISRDEAGRIEYHYVIVDYVCQPIGGSLRSATDVDDAHWVSRADLAPYELTIAVGRMIERAFALITASVSTESTQARQAGR